jgi:flagellar biosynthesis protein FliP
MRAIAAFCLLTVLFVACGHGAQAQDITISLGDGDSLTQRALQLMVIVTALSLLPGLVVMVTCFPFLVTVLSILRQGIGLQSAPPNMLIVSLAMFLTFYIMESVLIESWETGISPLLEGTLPAETAIVAALDPFRAFMENRVDPDTYAALADLRPAVESGPDAPLPLATLVPSFLLSEIERAFQVGFLIFLPFLIIDLVVAAVLMSMGMMMVPPAIVALPFKLAFFVVADGWTLIAGALVQSYQ